MFTVVSNLRGYSPGSPPWAQSHSPALSLVYFTPATSPLSCYSNTLSMFSLKGVWLAIFLECPYPSLSSRICSTILLSVMPSQIILFKYKPICPYLFELVILVPFSIFLYSTCSYPTYYIFTIYSFIVPVCSLGYKLHDGKSSHFVHCCIPSALKE